MGLLGLLMHKPMGAGSVGPFGVAWRKAFAEWRARCDEARSHVYVRTKRAAIKASRLKRWKERKAKRAERRRLARAVQP